MRIELRVTLSPQTQPFTWQGHAPQLRLGRAAGSDLVFDGEGSQFVSGQHARIALEAGGAQITDLGSRNGTYLNGQRVEGTRPLASGDRISLGQAGPRLDVVALELPQPAASPVLATLIEPVAAAPAAQAAWAEPVASAGPVASHTPAGSPDPQHAARQPRAWDAAPTAPAPGAGHAGSSAVGSPPMRLGIGLAVAAVVVALGLGLGALALVAMRGTGDAPRDVSGGQLEEKQTNASGADRAQVESSAPSAGATADRPADTASSSGTTSSSGTVSPSGTTSSSDTASTSSTAEMDTVRLAELAERLAPSIVLVGFEANEVPLLIWTGWAAGPRHVVTTADAVAQLDRQAASGEAQLFVYAPDAPSPRIAVRQTLVHPRFDPHDRDAPTSTAYDLGLLVLEEPLPAHAGYATLAELRGKLTVGETVMVLAYDFDASAALVLDPLELPELVVRPARLGERLTSLGGAPPVLTLELEAASGMTGGAVVDASGRVVAVFSPRQQKHLASLTASLDELLRSAP